MNSSEKSDEKDNIIVNKDDEQLDNKKKNLKNWCIANIILFFISITLFNLGINAFQYLINADEYTIGIGMILGIPIIVFLFGMFVMGLGIIAFVFEIISMKKILTGEVNNTFKIITLLEICGYIVFYLLKLVNKY